MTIRLGRLSIVTKRGQRYLGPEWHVWERYFRVEFVIGERK